MVTIKLFLGEQDGAEFERESCPPLIWVDSYDAQAIKKSSEKYGMELDDGVDLPLLPYVLTTMEKEDGHVVAARYEFCADLLEREPATEEDESSK